MTFPFLFGVMFGDMAHGSILMMFGAFLVLKNESLKGSMFGAFSSIRYFIFLMGFFATYAGFLYNDFLSLSFNFFGSCYDASTTIQCPDDKNSLCYPYSSKNDNPEHPDILTTCVYPFGIDPVWAITSNSITYMNSYKMKLAVIIGVLQMCIGIILKGVNAISFREPLDFFFEFVP
jgi:V-type H+-transporting ATPase subunit a